MMSLGSREELGAHHVDGLPSRGHVNRGRFSLLGGSAKETLRCAYAVCPCRSGGWWRPVGAGDILAGSVLCRPAWRHPLTLACDQDCFGSDSQLKASSCARCCGGATTVALSLCFLSWFSCKGLLYSASTLLIHAHQISCWCLLKKKLWHVEQKGRGGGGVCQVERIHIYSLFRVGCPHGGGLSRLRGVVYHRGLSACWWLSHLRGVVSRRATIVAKTSSNSQGRLVGS
jgi:hypothetical protein